MSGAFILVLRHKDINSSQLVERLKVNTTLIHDVCLLFLFRKFSWLVRLPICWLFFNLRKGMVNRKACDELCYIKRKKDYEAREKELNRC